MSLLIYFFNIYLDLVTHSKESICQAGDMGSIPVLGRSPEEGNGNPFQCSCLGNPMDRGAWWAAVHVAAKDLDTI